jgi:hypothetical protein
MKNKETSIRVLSLVDTLRRPCSLRCARGGEGLSPRATRIVSFFVIGCLLLGMVGCGPQWKRKFVRKRAKQAAPAQPILELQPDMKAVMPAADRYREHYAFWKSWHSELLLSFGQIQKRDQRYLAGSINELRAMQSLLAGKPSDEMKTILLQLAEIQSQFMSASPAWKPSASIRTQLERIQRQVNRDFQYSAVKQSLVADPS